jgi:hypothetical protein
MACLFAFLWLVCVIGLLLYLLIAQMEADRQRIEDYQRKQAKAAAEAAAKMAAARREAARREEQVRRDKEAEHKMRVAEREAIEKAAGFKQTPSLSNGQQEKFDAIDAAIREILMARLGRSERLTVRCMASPTGRIAFDWVVTDPRLKNPTVTVFRDDKLVMHDVGVANQWGGQLARGQFADFKFRLSGDFGQPEEVLFEMHIPTAAQWNDAVRQILLSEAVRAEVHIKPVVDAATSIEQEIGAAIDLSFKLQKMKADAYQRVDHFGMSDEDKLAFKAGVDSIFAKTQDRYEL